MLITGSSSNLKGLKTGYLTKFSKFFYLFKSTCKQFDALCEQTRMLMKQNVNDHVSKDSIKRNLHWNKNISFFSPSISRAGGENNVIKIWSLYH